MRVLGTNVLLQQGAKEEKRNGIYVPVAAQQAPWVVVGLGPLVTEVAEGEKVIPDGKHSARFTHETGEYVVVDQDDILVVL